MSTLEWLVPAARRDASASALFGLGVQQLLLRWNQGQELRQALITIAISVIVADQIIAHFPRRSSRQAAVRQRGTWPGSTDASTCTSPASATRSRGSSSSRSAIAVGLGCSGSGCTKTRTGMVIRAGVDDRQMIVGARDRTSSRRSRSPSSSGRRSRPWAARSAAFAEPRRQGSDGEWLLYSLVVVIIGGMGSLVGAAVGSLLLGLVFDVLRRLPAGPATSAARTTRSSSRSCSRARARVPSAGPLRESRHDDSTVVEHARRARDRCRARSSLAVLAPAARSATSGSNSILTQAFILGIAAASLSSSRPTAGWSRSRRSCHHAASRASRSGTWSRTSGGEPRGSLSAGTRRWR